MAAEPETLLWATHEVALGNLDEDDFNTLVLSGIDVVVPVELDLDGDPLQDDLVRLRSEDGYFDVMLASSDPDVEADPDAGYLNYCFRLVPPGVYRVSVLVAEQWVPLVRRLVVKRDGVYVNGEQIGDAPPEQRPSAPPEDEAADEPASDDDRAHAGCGH
jgi:hypothetical protein